MKERVVRTALQAIAAACGVVAAAIGASIGAGRTPSKPELVVAAWAAFQAVLTTIASALAYKIYPPNEA